MALVKKLQVGGQVDENTLNNELNTQLESFNLKGKDERKVRDALVKFRDYFKDSKGKSFSVDPLSQKYTVSGPGSESFTGSPDEIHRGWFTGNLKIQNEQDAMSIAAAIYNKALSGVSGKTGGVSGVGSGATGTREAINIGDLGEFVISDIYGTKDNFKTGFGTIKKDEDRKAKVFDFAQQKINDYLKKTELGKDKYDYADVQKVKDIQDAINKKDWDAFQNAAYKVKWEPQKFLLTEEQRKQLETDTKTAAATKAKESFDKLGLAPELQQKLYTAGFTESAPEDWTPDANTGWFKDVLHQHGARVLYNPTTKRHIAVTKNNYFNYGMSDQFHPGYGYSWSNDETGFNWYNPQQHSANAGVWGADKYAGQNIGRELITNMPGKVYGWSDERDGQYAKDFLGRRDFTKQLVIVQDGVKKYLTRGDDHVYRDKQGRPVDVHIKGFGDTHTVAQTYDIPEEFKSLGNYSHYNEQSVYPLATQYMEQLEKKAAGQNIEVNQDDFKNVITSLNAISQNSASESEKLKALKTLNAIKNLIVKSKYDVPFKKSGGVLKAASGTKLDSYLNKYGTPSAPTQASAQAPKGPGQARNIAGTWKGQSGAEDFWTGVSLAGTAGSFIPGYGAIGAGVSTVADIAKDIAKDGFQ